MCEIIDSLKIKFPGRSKQIDLLLKIFGEVNDVPCQAVFLYGHSATGKSSLLQTLLKNLGSRYVWINCFETYSQRQLLEGILKQLSPNFDSFSNCDDVSSFLYFLKEACERELNTLYLVLDNAERIRDLPSTLLASLLRLQELSNLNICTVFVSEIIWEKFRCGIQFQEPFPIHFQEYNKEEVLEILQLDQPNGFSMDFYRSYLNLVLSVFYMATRDARELRYIAVTHFPEYCRPIESGEVKETEVRKLWCNIEPVLRRALDSVYLREASSKEGAVPPAHRALVELPFYSKFLLLAAYMASYNSPKTDRKFFIKNQGRSRKKRPTNTAANQHLKGPKVFPLRRLLAIFYSIVGEKVAPSATLFSQISSLVALKLLSVAGDSISGDPKYKCLVSLDTIRTIARSVGFDIVQHLNDFT